MTTKSKKLTEKQREQRLEEAKAMFMEYYNITEIAKKVKLPRTTIDHHAKKKWELERELNKAELYQALTDSKKFDFTKMTKSAITVMARALEDLATRQRAPNVHEAKKASEILDILDKITRLDDNKPTDIIANEKPATVIEVREKLRLDPFSDIETIEYKEKSDESNEEDA